MNLKQGGRRQTAHTETDRRTHSWRQICTRTDTHTQTGRQTHRESERKERLNFIRQRERERERDTHTHTHTGRETETERKERLNFSTQGEIKRAREGGDGGTLKTKYVAAYSVCVSSGAV